MSTSIESRIKEAEKRINELKRTESSNGYVAITNKNVVLPDAVKETSSKSRVLKIRIVSLSAQDDDLMISINGVKIFDTQLAADQYYGEIQKRNPLWKTEGFRIATITKDEAIAKGAKWLLGSEIKVNTANIIGNNYRTGKWIAYLYLDSRVIVKRFGGTTKIAKGAGTPAERNSPPIYYSNGSFKLI